MRKTAAISLVCLIFGLFLVARQAHTTVTTTHRTVTHTGTGGKTFVVDYPHLDETHLVVTKITIADSSEEVLTLGTDYTVKRTSRTAGLVTTTNAISSDYQIQIQRVIPIKQLTAYRTQGRFLAESHEDSFDKLTMIAQQLSDGATQSEETNNAITNHIASSDDHEEYLRLLGRDGGQTANGGTASGEDLVLLSTAHATKGEVNIESGELVVDVNATYGVVCADDFQVGDDADITDDAIVRGSLAGSDASGESLTVESTTDATKGNITLGGIVTVQDDEDEVGINIANPTQLFHVEGAALINSDLYGGDASGDDLTLRSTSDETYGKVIAGPNNDLVVDELNSRVGILTSSPDEELHVVGDALVSGTIWGGNASGDDLVIGSTSHATKGSIQIGQFNQLYIDDTALRVGVNNTSPTVALDVAGSSIFTSGVYGGSTGGDVLQLYSSTHASKGFVYLGAGPDMVINDTSGNVGINQTNPSEKLEVIGNVVIGDTLYGGTGDGDNLDLRSTSHINKSQITFADHIIITEDENKLTIGQDAASNGVGALSVSSDTNGAALFVQNTREANDGFGIDIWAGEAVPSKADDIVWVRLFDADGSGGAGEVAYIGSTWSPFGASFQVNSDARVKENIEDTEVDGLDVINRIPLRQYDYIESGRHSPIGYVAQEVIDVYPPMVSGGSDGEYYRVGDGVLTPVLVKAIQQLTARVEQLESECGGSQ